MKFISKTECRNQERGTINDQQLTAIINCMPESMNSVSMAKTFFAILDSYDMLTMEKAAEVTGVLLSVIQQRDKEKRKGKVDAN